MKPSTLCVGLGTVSDSLLPFLGPVLDLATDLQQQAHIYLLEVNHYLKIVENFVNVRYYVKLKDREHFVNVKQSSYVTGGLS
jgi:hypothetical protein